MKNSLQMEWQYLHRTVSDAGTFFDGVEEALASEFLPSLFGVDEDITCKCNESQQSYQSDTAV